MRCNKPLSKSSLKPTDGFGDKIILFNSSLIRSLETIEMRSLFLEMALNEFSSMVNPN
jgi:hypothetical protein